MLLTGGMAAWITTWATGVLHADAPAEPTPTTPTDSWPAWPRPGPHREEGSDPARVSFPPGAAPGAQFVGPEKYSSEVHNPIGFDRASLPSNAQTRSMLRRARSTAMPRVRKQGSGVEAKLAVRSA